MSARVRQQSTVPSTKPGRAGGGAIPEYQPCQFPLNPAAQRALASLISSHSQSHNLKRLDSHLDEAQAAVSSAAGEINDQLTKKEVANKKRKHRAEQEDDADAVAEKEEESRLEEERLEELRDKVERMTARMEEGMRKLIDGSHSVQAVKAAVGATAESARVGASTQASTQGRSQRRRTRMNEDGEEEEDDEEYQDFEPTDPAAGTQAQASMVEKFKTDVEKAKAKYQAYSLGQRYAENPNYRDFTRVVHDARNPNEETQLAHHSDWFPEGERPAPGVTTRRAGAAENEDAGADSDDDIAVSKATISTKCPLTLQEFKAPLTSTKCPHSFEGEAILQMISNSRPQPIPGGNGKPEKAVQCPVSGCSKFLTKADLMTDNVLVRKIKRIQEAARLEEEDDSDEGEGGTTQRGAVEVDDEDGVMVDDVVEGRTQVKAEARGTGRSAGGGGSGRVSGGQAEPMRSQVVDLGGSSDEDEDEEAEEGEEDEMEE